MDHSCKFEYKVNRPWVCFFVFCGDDSLSNRKKRRHKLIVKNIFTKGLIFAYHTLK
jgi:hypothetical protein